MYRTLQWYVLREMGKTFALTAIGLSIVLSMGGGALRILQVEGASAVQILKIMLVVIPTMTTLSLPVAALFSAAMTFGRLSADNELTACRACGVNILWLMMPCVLMSVVVCLFTFYFSNYVIPGFVHQLDALLRKDIQRIVESQLRGSGTLGLQQKFRLHVDRVHEVAPENPSPDVGYLNFTGGAFVQSERGRPAIVATARNVLVRFEKSVAPATVTASMTGVRSYDLERQQFYAIESETFGPIQPPISIPLKPKWLNLNELIYYRDHTEELPDIKNLLSACRRRIQQFYFHKSVLDGLLNEPREVVLRDEHREYRIRAGGIERKEDPVRLRGNVSVVETEGEWRREYRGEQAALRLVDGKTETAPPRVEIEVFGNVTVVDSRQPEMPLEFPRRDLTPVDVPAGVLKAEAAIPDAIILDVTVPGQWGSPVDHAREALRRERSYFKYRIIGILHSRAALSLSVLVVVILGATLGIIARGGHVMTAFGVSFAPSLLVTTVIAMGRQVAENENTVFIGLAIIWGILVVMALVDALLLFKFVRR